VPPFLVLTVDQRAISGAAVAAVIMIIIIIIIIHGAESFLTS